MERHKQRSFEFLLFRKILHSTTLSLTTPPTNPESFGVHLFPNNPRDSPFIVNHFGQCYDEESTVNIFMEDMEGGDLSSLSMRCKRLPEMVIKAYTTSILKGLQYLHGNGIIHCDIKAKNVVLGFLGEVKLANFSAAKRISNDLLDIHDRTLGWMAPEISKGREQGMPSDIWSLSCTVVEMTTGKVPYLSPEKLKLTGILDCNLDFLGKCFMREPSERWMASQLHRHPFFASAHLNKYFHQVLYSTIYRLLNEKSGLIP
ncbi:mitogen-activated protein kinase kinase kinase 2 [Amborella trichopoda]|nr:mitogen-activated protein kinase kinase kinase 2 [Amborella trichopoda]|eukprot:XP_006850615.2 mitogen-activated protein kinase kinase kinase 2 [Amborella trichopoda]